MTDEQPTKPVRHLLGLSGGKDSSALAIYLRDKVPEMEYFFADTGAELPETCMPKSLGIHRYAGGLSWKANKAVKFKKEL